MLRIEIESIGAIDGKVVDDFAQSIADALATALVFSPHVDVGEDGVDMKITTTRMTEVSKDYAGEAG